MDTKNTISAPKTATFQMRINPEIKHKVEEIYAQQGLTLTDAVNLFIQQSIRQEGLPFLPSPDNQLYLKEKAYQRLTSEVQQGWDSAEQDGWISEEDAYKVLGLEA